jgi:hypothetical protein
MTSTFVRTATLALTFGAAVLFTPRAHAQLEPIEPAPQPIEPAPPAPPGGPEAPSQPEYLAHDDASVAAAEPAFDSAANWGEPSDHDRVVGRLAVAYLGVMGVPVHDATPNSTAIVDAPTLGIRYWFSDGLGIDAGLGLGLLSTGGSDTTASTDTDKPGSTLFGLGLHLGMPISAWDTAHYNAILIPELNFGFATGENGGVGPGSADDVALSGLLFGVGFRAGAEFHLEVLDLPQSTIQLTIGIGLAFEMRDAENDPGTMGESLNTLELGTNLVSLGEALRSGIQVFFYL